METILKAQDITYRYDPRKPDGILSINLELKAGEILALLGPSGAGKTTLLKILSGEIKPQEGRLEKKTGLQIGYVKQRMDVLESTTVYDHLFAKLSFIEGSEKRENQIRSVLSQLDLTNEIYSELNCLSGGQFQRVTIACELAKNPDILFFDEPFANLDWTLKEDLLLEVLPVLKERGIAVIWTTHHYQEVFPHANRMMLINSGEIQSLGTPEELYFKPNNIFTALYFGQNNILPGNILGLENELFAIRPNQVQIAFDSKENFSEGNFVESQNYGAFNLWKIKFQDNELWVQVNPRMKPQKKLYVCLPKESSYPIG